MPAGNPLGYLTPAEVEQLNRLGGLGAQQRQLAEALKRHQAYRAPEMQYETSLGGGLGGLASGLAAALRGQKEEAMASQLGGLEREQAAARQGAMGAAGRLPTFDASSLYASDPAQAEAARAQMKQTVDARHQLAQQFIASGDPQLVQFGQGLMAANEKLGGQAFEVGQGRFEQAGRVDLQGKQAASEMELARLREKAAMQRLTASEAAAMERLEKELEYRAVSDAAKLAADRTKEGRQATEGLRKEFNGNPVVKSFHEVSTAMGKVEAAGKTATAAGDMALIFAYMKMLDPGSTVREGEYASAQNATGVPGQVINLYNKAKDGQLLNPQMRSDFLARAREMFQPHQAEFQKLAGQYQGLATKQGLDPADVVGFGLTPDEAARLQQLEAQAAQAGKGGGG